MSDLPRIEYQGIIYTLYKNRKYYINVSKKKILHREIWKFHHGNIPEGKHIHHKDLNPLNNNIENLECVSPKEHGERHSKMAKEKKEWDIYLSKKIWHSSLNGKIHHRALARKNWDSRYAKMKDCKLCGKKTERINEYCKLCNKKINREKKTRKKQTYYDKKIVDCIVCGAKVGQKTVKIKLFCSKKCKAKNRRNTYKDHVERNCLICHKKFMISKFSKTQTCNPFCRSKFISLQMKKGG